MAIPTAIPDEPFTSKLGNLAGKTCGSLRVSSKLGAKSTVSLLISANSSVAIRAILASVYLIAAGESPSIEPKLPWPSTSKYLVEKSCATLTMASYTEESPWG